MKKWKSRIAVSLSAILLLTSFSIPTMAEEVTALKSTNVNGHNYTNWPGVINSYLADNGDGTLTRVEANGKSVYVEKYNLDGAVLDQKIIDRELASFGGFYSGKDYNFLVFGQNNTEKNNEKEVIRVVKYTKDWEREGEVSLKNTNITKPFNFGGLRMEEYDDVLFVRTCREMYNGHQSNFSFAVDIPSMKLITKGLGAGYISHSFNQFLTIEDSVMVAAEHGDTYPRGIILLKYSSVGKDGSTGTCTSFRALPLLGSGVYTGASLGGLVSTGSSYLTAGNAVAQDNKDTYSVSGIRNIFVTSTPKDNFSAAGTSVNWITDYENKAISNTLTPYLVKFNDDLVLLLYTTADGKVHYAFLDGKGIVQGEIKTMDGAFLSSCEPIVVDDTAIWYYTNNSTPVFCQITIDGETSGGADVFLNHYSYELKIEETVELSAGVSTPPDADRATTWTSSNPSVATVDEEGLVTAVKAGTANITAKINGKTLTCRITVKSPIDPTEPSTEPPTEAPSTLAPSRGSSSTRGSSSGSNTSSSNNTGVTSGTNSGSNSAAMPSYVSQGSWRQNSNGTWSFTNSSGTSIKNSWGAIANPYANTSAGQSSFDWFAFDENGSMRTGWFTDTDKNTYYLNEHSDGTKGRMMTGWCWIADAAGVQKCYYLNPISDGTRGKLLVNTTIDGYTVNENGEWVVNGVVQTK